MTGLRPWSWSGQWEETWGDHWPPLVPSQECTDGYEWDPESQHCRGECALGIPRNQEVFLLPRYTPNSMSCRSAGPRPILILLGRLLEGWLLPPKKPRKSTSIYPAIGQKATGHCPEELGCVYSILCEPLSCSALCPTAAWEASVHRAGSAALPVLPGLI